MKEQTARLTHDLRGRNDSPVKSLYVYIQLTLHACDWANFTSTDVFPQLINLSGPDTGSGVSLYLDWQFDSLSEGNSKITDKGKAKCVGLSLEMTD